MKEVTGVGIDVSKGHSMVAVRQSGGVVVSPPFRVNNTASELQALVEQIRRCLEKCELLWSIQGRIGDLLL